MEYIFKIKPLEPNVFDNNAISVPVTLTKTGKFQCHLDIHLTCTYQLSISLIVQYPITSQVNMSPKDILLTT